MSPKLTLKDCQELALSKGGKCLSETYINCKIKMEWECKEGHQWSAVFSNIKRGRWCLKCNTESQKLSIEECKEFGKAKGGKCLSETYVGVQSKMKWECKEGHQWKARFHNIKNEQWCPYCSGNAKLSIEECKEFAISKEGKCLSETYINTRTKMLWECKEGHQWETRFKDIKNGKWCPYCSGNVKLSIEECQEFAISKEGKCLSETYFNCDTKMEWECKEGHQWIAKFIHIKKGTWCPVCRLCPSCMQYNTGGKLCMITCNPLIKNKNTEKARTKSKEWAVVYYLREQLEEEFIHNQSVGSHCTKNDRANTNGHIYPDIRFDCGFYHLIVEVDEHQHRGADYSCDKRRMYDIIAKLGLPCIFIRYNPDNKNSDETMLLEKINEYLNIEIEDSLQWNTHGFKAEYMYYSD